MDALTVYTKTPRGIRELGSPVALKKEQLAVLKLVDGKSSVNELGQKGKDVESTLITLEKQGYIRVFESRNSAAAASQEEPAPEVDDFDFTTQLTAISSFADSNEPEAAPAAHKPPATIAETGTVDERAELRKAHREADAVRMKAQEDVQRAQAMKLDAEIKAFEHAEAAMALRAEAEEHAKEQLRRAIQLKEAAERKAREDLERAAQIRTEMQRQLKEMEDENYQLREQLRSELAEVARLKDELAAKLSAAGKS
jgi:hypothetical protein